jgi:hypothetical protein
MPPASRARKAPASPSTPLPPLKTTAADLAAMPLVALIGRLREMRVPDERVDAAMDRSELVALAKKQEEGPDDAPSSPAAAQPPVVFAMQSNTPMREAPGRSKSAQKRRPTSSPDARPTSAAASAEPPRESRYVRNFYNLAATMGENGMDNVKVFTSELKSWLDDNNDIDSLLPTSRKGVLGKHNGKSLATVACSSAVNAPECLKVILKNGANALKGVSEGKCAAMQAATITASLPKTGLDDRCLQELRAMQMQKDLEKTMSPEELKDTKRMTRKEKCIKCGAMWRAGRYPKPHKFASCDNDGMAPWHEAAVKSTGTLKSAIALQGAFSKVEGMVDPRAHAAAAAPQ